MSDTAIQVKNLTKSYGKTPVLKGVDFIVPKGTVFCLLGSNGAGKTTIISILATVIKPNGGEASICGYDVQKEAKQVRRHISLTGQYAAVDELLTAHENLIMTGRLFHIQNPKQTADELLSRFGLTADAHKKVSAYSGGMRRRLDIAMSLCGGSEIIFLDEPTTGLDPQNRLEMWRIVRELANSGMTVFLTTQYLEEAERLADTIAVLHEGKIVTQGTPSELKSLMSDSSTMELTISSKVELSEVSDRVGSLPDVELLQIERKYPSLEEVFLQLVHQREGKSDE